MLIDMIYPPIIHIKGLQKVKCRILRRKRTVDFMLTSLILLSRLETYRRHLSQLVWSPKKSPMLVSMKSITALTWYFSRWRPQRWQCYLERGIAEESLHSDTASDSYHQLFKPLSRFCQSLTSSILLMTNSVGNSRGWQQEPARTLITSTNVLPVLTKTGRQILTLLDREFTMQLLLMAGGNVNHWEVGGGRDTRRTVTLISSDE